MKTLTINLIGIYMIVAMAACQGSHRHVVIKTGDNYNMTCIEYWGRVVFNTEGTGILHISPNGSVKYSHDNQQLVAESDYRGHITYRINGGEKEQQLSPPEKLFVASAIKEMIKHGHNDH
ncbi:hypothetical protein [Mucilaginibacter panaciglaebae]|uniref:NlpE-like protein n=1 Tax=Mucilaginibacter panaciglaebae TaxID=502331 RepID=A0ABP7WTG5_9SPHI